VIFFFGRFDQELPDRTSFDSFNNYKSDKMPAATQALTTKVASGTPYQLDDNQVLRSFSLHIL
jgi:hypothetical protein